MINLYKSLDNKTIEELEIKKGLVLYHLYCQDYETINTYWKLDEFRNTHIIDLTSICLYILDNHIDNSFKFLQYNSYNLIYLTCILLLKNNMIGNNIMEKYFSELIEKELKYQTLYNLINTLIDDISEELENNKYSFILVEKEYKKIFNYKFL